MSELIIDRLAVEVGGKQIVTSVSLAIGAGEGQASGSRRPLLHLGRGEQSDYLCPTPQVRLRSSDGGVRQSPLG